MLFAQKSLIRCQKTGFLSSVNKSDAHPYREAKLTFARFVGYDLGKEKLVIANMMFKLTLIVLSLATILAGCSDSMTTFDETVRVQNQYESQLMSLPGVVGVGIGECDREPCLKVFVTEMTPELGNQIPDELDGVKVDIEVT